MFKGVTGEVRLTNLLQQNLRGTVINLDAVLQKYEKIDTYLSFAQQIKSDSCGVPLSNRDAIHQRKRRPDLNSLKSILEICT